MWTLSKNESWPALEAQFSWLADMRGVPQDGLHHAEGDVATHTAMVLEALCGMEAFAALPPQDRELLRAATLLHDVEKRSCTRTDAAGRIVSPGHAKRGEFTARAILFREVETPFALREHIAALVRYHGLPLWIFHKPDPVRALAEASLRLDTRLLALLARADVLGRHCPDRAELLERIDFFEAFCQEQDCWGTPFSFPSPNSRYHYFHHENAAPGYEPFDDSRCEVVMMSGLPGMGKDHYLQKHHPDLPVISLDAIRQRHRLKPTDRAAAGWVGQQAREAARELLRRGSSFAWNATNLTRMMREGLTELFGSYKARIRMVYVEVPYRQWLAQNRNRAHPVPEAVLERMLQKLEVPQLWEAGEIIYPAATGTDYKTKALR